MTCPIDVDAPLAAAVKRNKSGNKKRTTVKKSSMGIKKRFDGGAGKPSGAKPVEGSPRRQSGGGFNKAVRLVPSNDNREVRINLSNLAPSVLSSDLRQLFAEFRIKNVSVNFNEHGKPVGTGDVALSKRDADRLIQKFAGVALDGQEMKLALIDSTNIANRVKFPTTPRQPRVPKPAQRTPNRKPAGKGAGKPVGAKPVGAKGKKPKREPQVKKTVEELDAELDAYMTHA